MKNAFCYVLKALFVLMIFKFLSWLLEKKGHVEKQLDLNYFRFSYTGNWKLVKSIVVTKIRKSHVCLHSQARIRL